MQSNYHVYAYMVCNHMMCNFYCVSILSDMNTAIAIVGLAQQLAHTRQVGYWTLLSHTPNSSQLKVECYPSAGIRDSLGLYKLFQYITYPVLLFTLV